MCRPRVRKAPELSPPPGRDEWYFEKIPESELAACSLWEYARESAWMRDLKRRCELPEVWMMKNSEAHKFVGEDIMLVQSAWNASHVLAHGLFSGNPMLDTSQGGNSTNAGDNLGVVRFPCPWQQLNPQERARRAGIPDIKYAGPLLPFKRGHWSTAKWLTEYGEAASGQSPPEHPARPGWRPGQSILFAGAEMGIFEIGWDLHTNEEICAAFAQWVSQNRPTEMPTPDRRGQRLYDIKVALRRLGIMRLLHRCPLSQMAGWCPAAWKRYGKFEWFKERKRAGDIPETHRLRAGA